ncbi:Nn.00g061320.m01.CDS01 [Neocucurbitaria sp. VM-36]
MMRVEPNFNTGSLPEFMKRSIAVQGTLLSPSPLEEAKKCIVTVQVIPVSPPLSPPPEENNSVDPLLSHDYTTQLATLQKFEPRPVVAVIGVGYVGTHLVEAFAHHYKVIAFDLSEKRLGEVAKQLDNLPIEFTSSASDIGQASHFLIAVPTLLNRDKTIDTTYIRNAITTVEENAKPGSTIVIESTVAVGMTRSLFGPLLSTKNFLVGMSPERVDPGRVEPAFENIPKIISGLNQASINSIYDLYSCVFAELLPVSSPEVAEMTKLYENCQRMICAAYANEMANACDALGIDAFEVSAAAASKPFGYLPFRPGPGIGGHCIPVNPYYLLATCAMPLLEQAVVMSSQRPAQVARGFMKLLMPAGGTVEHGRISSDRLKILVVGVGFKRGQSVLSNSPGRAIIHTLLNDWDTYVEFADPLVDAEQMTFVPKMDTELDWNEDYLETFDGILVAVDQIGLDLDILDRLQRVKVEDYSGRHGRRFVGDSFTPTIPMAGFSDKTALQAVTERK